MKDNIMDMKRRFSLEEHCIIDNLNQANTGKGWWFDGDPEDDSCLRECVLWPYLNELLDKLIIKYSPYEHRLAVSPAVFYAIKASQLNSFNPTLSIQHRFGGILKREM